MDKKNWWVTEYNNDETILCEWLLGPETERDAIKIAATVVDNDTARGWDIREATIVIEVKNGAVYDVSDLPDGWNFEIVDYDSQEEDKPEWNSRT